MMSHIKHEWKREVEQRYAIDPSRWLYLPKTYTEYHQAEIGSGKASEVIREFLRNTEWLLSWPNIQYGDAIQWLFSQINPSQRIKLRIRRIFDPREYSLRAEFTLKEKLESWVFKVYNEHNIAIDAILALSLIEHIAPRLEFDGNPVEYWVRKFRYNVQGPDTKIWNIDVLQWYNSWLTLWEIEVTRKNTRIELPKYAVLQVNGKSEFRFLWTAELQKNPWQQLPADVRENYIRQIYFPYALKK